MKEEKKTKRLSTLKLLQLIERLLQFDDSKFKIHIIIKFIIIETFINERFVHIIKSVLISKFFNFLFK